MISKISFNLWFYRFVDIVQIMPDYKVRLLLLVVFLMRSSLTLLRSGLMFSDSKVSNIFCLHPSRDGIHSLWTPSMLRNSSKKPFQSAFHHRLMLFLGIHLPCIFLISMYWPNSRQWATAAMPK